MESKEEKEDLSYLGMSESQFGVLVSLTSLSFQLDQIVYSGGVRQLMSNFILEHKDRSTEENLKWIRSQRDHLLNILNGVLVSQSVIAQVDDALTSQLAAQKSTVDAVNNENSGE